ncbi:CheY-homologous receiver domain and PAS domain-containing protein [Klebsormidium nitens]|uniref:CheY-homologous receiver domain and PAS domain-containing protein n=1 Tax=Klebsormidium nitens TaxID=105231 RepID=A0A1Y1IPH8_KLENI|nr:CheY-homologous receiver domain and PAS domain-containing protein [Klebsormidium nitens]|eukprot:GAQ91091.1 CheY-homologous receiver domain and PAS domain-containing protein [Klebsormidium nitens]
MFLDVPARQVAGASFYGQARAGDLGSSPPFLGFNNTHHKAALDFVLELAGPRCLTPVATKVLNSDPFVNLDELPLGAFAVDRELALTLWNRKLGDLTGWTEADVCRLAAPFPGVLLEPAASTQAPRTCAELLRGAINGKDTSGAEFHLALRGRRRQKVLLSASLRTDVAGAVSGALCVVCPIGPPVAVRDAPPLPGLEDDLDAPAAPPRPLAAVHPASVGGASSLTLDSATECGTPTVKRWEGDACFALERTQSSPVSLISSRASFGSLDGASSLDLEDGREGRLRALVVDEVAAHREVLTALLERCGFEVACASSAKQAAWRFEAALSEKRGFRVLFYELMMAAEDRYESVRQLRRAEEAAGEAGACALIVGVTSMNRWDLAGMDACMERGLAAGMDAFIARELRMQHLRDTLRKLGLQSKLLETGGSLPRALSGTFHNPLNLSR